MNICPESPELFSERSFRPSVWIFSPPPDQIGPRDSVVVAEAANY
jgi:hypothetical protein